MDTIRDTVERTKDAVTRTVQSGTEPPSGLQGAGTADQPYDQGNAPEQPSAHTSTGISGTEPPSGVQGRGTVDQPFDQGNAPEQSTVTSASGTEPPSGIQGRGTVNEPYDQGNTPAQATATGSEPLSGVQGKGTVSQPYDQGNQQEQPTEKAPIQVPVNPSPKDPLASPSVTHQGSGNPLMSPTKEQEQVISETRGRDETAQRTTSTPDPAAKKSTGTAAEGGNFDAARAGAGKEATRLRYEERDVSPGELRDGTHVITSGARGETYAPGKMSKFKDKFHIGRERS